MSTRTGRALCWSWPGCLLLVCIASTNAWSDTDKTTVDLERGQPEAAARYQRPRAVQLYRHDKTEVDLATPLGPPGAAGNGAPQRPATLAPAPTTPPSRSLLPDGGR